MAKKPKSKKALAEEKKHRAELKKRRERDARRRERQREQHPNQPSTEDAARDALVQDAAEAIDTIGEDNLEQRSGLSEGDRESEPVINTAVGGEGGDI